MSIYQFQAETIDGQQLSIEQYKGKVLVIVNTASKCGFTPQYEELQRLYETYKEEGLEILGFPSNQFMHQEPGSSLDIHQFCKKNYGVSFPLFNKINVRGKKAHPLFQYLTNQAPGILTASIKWNFTKFLIAKDGHVVKRFAPNTSPAAMEKVIRKQLKE